MKQYIIQGILIFMNKSDIKLILIILIFSFLLLISTNSNNNNYAFVYYENKEVQMDADTIINMCEFPEEYSLFISKENGE